MMNNKQRWTFTSLQDRRSLKERHCIHIFQDLCTPFCAHSVSRRARNKRRYIRKTCAANRPESLMRTVYCWIRPQTFGIDSPPSASSKILNLINATVCRDYVVAKNKIRPMSPVLRTCRVGNAPEVCRWRHAVTSIA